MEEDMVVLAYQFEDMSAPTVSATIKGCVNMYYLVSETTTGRCVHVCVFVSARGEYVSN